MVLVFAFILSSSRLQRLAGLFRQNYMCNTFKLIRSLVLTAILTFASSMLIIGVVWGISEVVSYVPGFREIGHIGIGLLSQFLNTFGSGSPLEGMLVIGCTFSFVTGLFDAYTFYRYQHLRHY